MKTTSEVTTALSLKAPGARGKLDSLADKLTTALCHLPDDEGNFPFYPCLEVLVDKTEKWLVGKESRRSQNTKPNTGLSLKKMTFSSL